MLKVLADLFSDTVEHTLEHLQTGGWVMIPLVIVAMIMFFLIAKKFLEMRSLTKGYMPAEELVKTVGKTGFRAARWQVEIVEGFVGKRTFDEDLDRSILESLRVRQEGFVKRSIGLISVLAGVAPLLGLLGTVGGMITTFIVISQFGTGNAKALASGISEALITTQTGLVVAIPGLFLANYLHRRSEKLRARMRQFCLMLLRYHRVIETGKGIGRPNPIQSNKGKLL
jgi:biopolymer transport protein ExbB